MTENNNTTTAYDLSAGVFTRGLANLKTLLIKAEQHIAATGSEETDLLKAKLAITKNEEGVSYAPADLHMYSLAAQVHWAVEGANLAIRRLLGEQPIPGKSDEMSFADLHLFLDTTIAYINKIDPGNLELALDSTIMIERPGGSASLSGHHFLLAYAIPHFYYHLTTVYGILRNQGVHLTMRDFLGNWEKY
jgi:hypothetical protein